VHDLEYLFDPKSIAVIGTSANPGNSIVGVWPRVLPEIGFSGDIFLVSPEISQVKDVKIYSSLKDIPGNIDMVIISVPASAVPQVMEDCVAKGVKAVHVFSAGFRENSKEGAKLEREITRIAAGGGIRILGPNCMGIYNPAAGISWRPDFPRDSGNLGFLSQSGFNATNFLKQAAARGIRFSKVINYGNACDLNETDFIKYFASDKETKAIAAYIEGVKDGHRFFQVLREVVKVKPVILLRGGRTDAGVRATASHTGAISTKDTIWDALFKQTGATSTDSIEELIDTLVAFLCIPPPRDRRVALIGPGGGPNVLGTDHFARAGLTIPPLSTDIIQRLSRFTPKSGTSLANPIDIIIGWTPRDWDEAIDIIGNSQQVDLLIIHLGMTYQHLLPEGIKALREINTAIINSAKRCANPTAIVLYNVLELAEVAQQERQRFIEAGFPVFPSLISAAQAIGKLMQYQDFRISLMSTIR